MIDTFTARLKSNDLLFSCLPILASIPAPVIDQIWSSVLLATRGRHVIGIFTLAGVTGDKGVNTAQLCYLASIPLTSALLLFCSSPLPVLCQFMMAFVVWDWDSMSHYRISNAYDFPGKLKMCHSLPCVTDTVLSNKCNRGCFFLVTINMDSIQECAIWYSSTLIQCPVSLSGQ